MPEPLCLTVLNHGGRDGFQDFSTGLPKPGDPGHAPVNFHAYAACTGGCFCDDWRKAVELGQPVLLLLRQDLGRGLKVLRELKDRGLTVAVSFKETGVHQVRQALAKPARLEQLRRILSLADGALAATPWLRDFYRAVIDPEKSGKKTDFARFIPTPYPLEDEPWDLAVPVAERSGILLGTREFSVTTRNHAVALLSLIPLVKEPRVPLWVVNSEGRRGAAFLREAQVSCPHLRIVEGSRPYTEYLRMLARCRLVFQLDQSLVPGQVAGDCLLAGTVCVGGNGAVESLVFPDFTGGPEDSARLREIAGRLLSEEAFYRQACENAQRTARQQVAFAPVARDLEDFFDQLLDPNQ